MITRTDRRQAPRGPALEIGFLIVVAALLCVTVLAVQKSPPPHELIEVVIRPGDTLWSLATTHYPGRDPREVVYIIREANGGLDPGAIRPGDVVLVPVEGR